MHLQPLSQNLHQQLLRQDTAHESFVSSHASTHTKPSSDGCTWERAGWQLGGVVVLFLLLFVFLVSRSCLWFMSWYGTGLAIADNGMSTATSDALTDMPTSGNTNLYFEAHKPVFFNKNLYFLKTYTNRLPLPYFITRIFITSIVIHFM